MIGEGKKTELDARRFHLRNSPFFSGNKSLEKSYLIAFLMSVRVVFEEKKDISCCCRYNSTAIILKQYLILAGNSAKRDGVCSKN